MQASHFFAFFWTSTLSIFCQCIIALADMLINIVCHAKQKPQSDHANFRCTTTTFQWLDYGYDILMEVTFIFHGPSLCVECVTHSSVLLPVPLSFWASFTSSKGSVWFLAQLATWLVLARWRRLGQTLLEYLIYIDIYTKIYSSGQNDWFRQYEVCATSGLVLAESLQHPCHSRRHHPNGLCNWLQRLPGQPMH